MLPDRVHDRGKLVSDGPYTTVQLLGRVLAGQNLQQKLRTPGGSRCDDLLASVHYTSRVRPRVILPSWAAT